MPHRLSPQLVLLISLAGGVHSPAGSAQSDEGLAVGPQSVSKYVLSCRKPNGAFGPADQEYTDAAWNYPAVRTLQLLGQPITNASAVLKHGLGYPQGHVGYGHWYFFHQHSIRKHLGAPMAGKQNRVRLVHQGYEVRYYGSPFGTGGKTHFDFVGGSQPDPRDIAASSLGYYNLSSLYYTLAGLEASGRNIENSAELVSFIQHRQAPSGGFVDVRTADGLPHDSDAHIAHTFQSLAALKLLGAEIPHSTQCAAFIQACQLSSGAFRWNPKARLPGNRADVYYTWAAARGLKLLGKKPTHREACIKWLNSLQNHDGGFGDRPGWRSRLYSTFYAVDALQALTGKVGQAITNKSQNPPKPETIPSGRFNIYQSANKMPVCDVKDLEGLQLRGFGLLALKSDNFELAKPLQDAARKMKPAMDVILCPEAYPHRTQRSGGVMMHHVGNMTLDPSWGEQQKKVWQSADRAGREGLRWPDYQRRVIQPLLKQGALFYPEQDFEMEFAYSVYDDGVDGESGYNAILAGFNWSPRDFVRVFPWRERYVDKLAPIADVDAHGDFKKWSPQLDHARHLYIAKSASYSDFLDAAANGRVVCVIHDAEGISSRATYYGRPSAVSYVKQHVEKWKWWK